MSTAEAVPDFTIHDRCRKAREVAGLDQEELAERIEVSRQTISNYETGNVTHLKTIVLRQWALACGVPLGWLRGGPHHLKFPNPRGNRSNVRPRSTRPRNSGPKFAIC